MGSDRYAGLRRAAVNAQQIPNPWVLAAYTAAAEPAVVLQLLDELDAAERERGEVIAYRVVRPRSEYMFAPEDVTVVRRVPSSVQGLEPRQGHPDGGAEVDNRG